MSPKILIDPTKEKWVNVTWLPHTNLSQSSHVCLSVRSAHAILDELEYTLEDREWNIRIGVYGLAGLPLVPVQSHTPAAACKRRDRRRSSSKKQEPTTAASVSFATHDCHFHYFVNVPIRWRDLPRDAYLLFEVLGQGDCVVYRTTMPFFTQYGKLKTGLQKLALSSSPLDSSRNHGLVSQDDSCSDNGDDYDPVWKAVLMLDQLERMEARARTNPAAAEVFGEIPSVPWLDALQKERAKRVIAEAIADGNVRTQNSVSLLD